MSKKMSDCAGKDQKFDFKPLEPILEQYRNIPGSVITILQNAQEIYGYLPREVIQYVSEQTGVKPAKIYGVSTFYTQFRFQPMGKYHIMLCQGTACHVNGSKMILEAVGEELGISVGETTEDGLFTLDSVACLGCCSLSPVMMINGETYGSLTKQKAIDVLKTLRAQAEKEGGKK